MHSDRKQRAPTDPVCSRGTGHEGDCNGAWRWDCPPGRAQKAREAAAYPQKDREAGDAIDAGTKSP